MSVLQLYAFVSVLAISLISFIGLLTLSLREEVFRKYALILVSLAAGALLGGAFIHLIPESIEEMGDITTVSIFVIVGILLFFILEKILHWHHHHEREHNTCALEERVSILPVGRLILVSDGIHNIIDGLIIGASYLLGVEAGIATTLAVMLHEIPQEIGDFGILIHSGYTKTKALWFNFFSALLAILGVAALFLLGEAAETTVLWLVPLAAGGFIYIAVADLIPELHKTKGGLESFVQIFAVVLGIIAMLTLTAVDGA